MSAMASRITSLTIVCSTVYSGAEQTTSKLRVTGLCAGNSPATGEFPAQMASNAENVSILMTSSWYGLHMCCINPIQMLGDVNSGTSRHPIKCLIRKSRESQSRESSRLLSQNNHIALEFSKRFGNRAAEMVVIGKLQISISRLRKIALLKFLSHKKMSYAILKQPGWSVINRCFVSKKQASRTGTSNYSPQCLWDIIICPCPWNVPLTHTSPSIPSTFIMTTNCCSQSRIMSIYIWNAFNILLFKNSPLKTMFS